MRAEPSRLTAPGRSCLALLCLILGASVAVRLQAYRADAGGMAAQAAQPPIDLGAGVLLPHARAGQYRVPVASCLSPARVTFVWAGPYGSDPSLADGRQAGDRVAYLYRGWNLGHRFATIGLNAIHFARRAHARLTTGRDPAADAVAVRIVVPGGCDASPEDVLAAFRSRWGASG